MTEKTRSQMAFLLCRDPQFWYYCNERSFSPVDSEESARAYVLEGCKATSRSRLDVDEYAVQAWDAQFFNPFTTYRKSLEKKVFS